MYDRSKTIGGSDAVMIHAGQWAELYDQKTSSGALSVALPAAIGQACEPLNREWFMQETSLRVHHNKDWADRPIPHPHFAWMVFTPDGLINLDEKDPFDFERLDNRTILYGGDVEIFEAKAVTPWWNETNLVNKYRPQLQHGMMVTGARKAHLSVFYLNNKWVHYEIPFDPIAAENLLRQEELFMEYLLAGERPPTLKNVLSRRKRK